MINEDVISKGKKNLIKLNKAEIARRIGRTRTWVSLVTNGTAPLGRKGIPTRKAIAEVLGVPYEELWGEEEDK